MPDVQKRHRFLRVVVLNLRSNAPWRICCPDFFELARKTTFKNLRHPPEALTLFSQGLNPTEFEH